MTTSDARYPGTAPIEAYGNGGFRFAGMSHRGSILCTPAAVLAWPVADLDALRPHQLAPLVDSEPRPGLLLFGVGRVLRFPPDEIRDTLRAAGIWLEVMDTGAACRTYNVLLAEQRSVAAALIAVD